MVDDDEVIRKLVTTTFSKLGCQIAEYENGKVFLDARYIISTIGGLYGRLDPERATRLLKKNLVTLDELGK